MISPCIECTRPLLDRSSKCATMCVSSYTWHSCIAVLPISVTIALYLIYRILFLYELQQHRHRSGSLLQLTDKLQHPAEPCTLSCRHHCAAETSCACLGDGSGLFLLLNLYGQQRQWSAPVSVLPKLKNPEYSDCSSIWFITEGIFNAYMSIPSCVPYLGFSGVSEVLWKSL